MVHPVKAGIAATALAGTAMAYRKKSQNDDSNRQYNATKNGGNFASIQTNSKKSPKMHDDAVKQMQMWKC